jgi:hypothetical protein
MARMHPYLKLTACVAKACIGLGKSHAGVGDDDSQDARGESSQCGTAQCGQKKRRQCSLADVFQESACIQEESITSCPFHGVHRFHYLFQQPFVTYA